MIDTVRTVEAHLDDRQTEEVEEDGVVRAGAKRVAWIIDRSLHGRGTGGAAADIGVSGTFVECTAPRRQHRSAAHRITHIAHSLDDQLVEARDRSGFEIRPTRGTIDVEIRDRIATQIVGELFTPFGRPGQVPLLGVPACEHNRALRPLTGARLRTQHSRELQLRRRAG